jgi:hypothetical protein
VRDEWREDRWNDDDGKPCREYCPVDDAPDADSDYSAKN